MAVNPIQVRYRTAPRPGISRRPSAFSQQQFQSDNNQRLALDRVGKEIVRRGWSTPKILATRINSKLRY
jgi:hypothetical protein